MRRKGLLTGIAIGLLVGMLLAPVLARPASTQGSIAAKFGLPGEWEEEFFIPLGSALHRIEQVYVEEVVPGPMLEGAYHGVLSKLDDYSSYMPPGPFKEFRADTQGEFGGLGIQIRFYPLEKLLKVEQPIPGTPAFRGGVLAGDIITKVREVATGEEFITAEFEDVHQAINVLRGKPGTSVAITVFHQDTRTEEEITIERAIIQVPGARGERMVDEGRKIGYVYVAAFHERTVRDLTAALDKLKEQGLRALILDLRFNSGGLLDSSVEMSDMFLEGGVVVSTRGRVSLQDVRQAKKGDVLEGAPLVILTNRYSASAAEIVAAAIKENKRGILVGETTFGKGSVQSVIPCAPEGGAIKLTTARYYTPDGVCIEKKGVEPDIEVKLSNEETRELGQALFEVVDFPPKPKEESAPEPTGAEAPAEQEQAEEEPYRDVQLERAMDILTGMLLQREQAE